MTRVSRGCEGGTLVKGLSLVTVRRELASSPTLTLRDAEISPGLQPRGELLPEQVLADTLI